MIKPLVAMFLGTASASFMGGPGTAFAGEDSAGKGGFAYPSASRRQFIELAGADDSGNASRKQLKDAGTEMAPDESLKKSSANPEPLKFIEEIDKPKVNPVPQPQSLMPAKQPEPRPAPQPVPDPAPEPEPLEEAEPEPAGEAPVETADGITGPYLRLDGGYGIPLDSDGAQAAGDFASTSIDHAPLLGIGLGYRVSEKYRVDVTIDYRSDAEIEATTAAGNTAKTEVNGASVMVNGYWDITRTEGFTPYVGAGLGYARLSTPTQVTTGGIANEAGATSGNLAWALMFGTAYAINDEAAIDLGYRFINLGEFKQAGTTVYEDLLVHEARAGFRYLF